MDASPIDAVGVSIVGVNIVGASIGRNADINPVLTKQGNLVEFPEINRTF